MRSKKVSEEPPRPFCSTCGKPEATHRLAVEANELVLERGAGLHTQPHWTPRYASGTRIEAMLCPACMKSHVQVSVAASADITKTSRER